MPENYCRSVLDASPCEGYRPLFWGKAKQVKPLQCKGFQFRYFLRNLCTIAENIADTEFFLWMAEVSGPEERLFESGRTCQKL